MTVSEKIVFQDPVLHSLHEQVVLTFGPLNEIVPARPTHYFEALCESIVSQQLSVKVADIIFARLRQLVGDEFTPEKVFLVPVEEMRGIGLSNAKAQYIHNIAEAWTSGIIIPDSVTTLSEAEIIDKLVQIKGVGRWTAEMFLIFTLAKPDIFSVGDYGLKKAIATHYSVDIKSRPERFLEISEQWQPYRSLASRILWKSLDLK